MPYTDSQTLFQSYSAHGSTLPQFDGMPAFGSAPARPTRSHIKMDVEQKLSQQLFSPSLSPMSSSSQTTISMSPAAMFLGAFASPMPAPATVAPAEVEGEGQVVAGFTLGKVIGHGAFSVIREATSAAGGAVAVKIVRRSDVAKNSDRKKLDNESTIWACLSHEHILPLFSTHTTSTSQYFVTLYCPAGSLYDILKRDGRPALPQDDVGMMFRQVVRGLRYMHESAGFVHRDIKLENVLVDEMGVCRITDFGMTKKIGESSVDEDEDTSERPRRQTRAGPHHLSLIRQSAATGGNAGGSHRLHRNATLPSSSAATPAHPAHVFQPGSLPYAAPELLQPHTSSTAPRVNPAQDIWALGVMLFALLTGRLPFADSFEPRLTMKILHGTYTMPPDIGLTAERIISGCLEPSVSQRWSVDMVDEVAWAVGWGSEGDDAEQTTPSRTTPATPALSREQSVMTRARSPSRGRVVDLTENDGGEIPKHDTVRPSMEAARRRSTSRMDRSLSRAPAVRSQSRVGLGNVSNRSESREPPYNVPRMASSVSRYSEASSYSSSSASSSSLLDSSRPASSCRGRRLGRRADEASESLRSASPSVMPSTPEDIGSGVDAAHHLLRRSNIPALDLDAPRATDEEEAPPTETQGYFDAVYSVATPTSNILEGRGRRGMRTPKADSGLYDGVSHLDVLQETSRWASSSLSPGADDGPEEEPPFSPNAVNFVLPLVVNKRAGSTPPGWARPGRAAVLRFAADKTVAGGEFSSNRTSQNASPATRPISIPGSSQQSPRSQSVDCRGELAHRGRC